MQLSIGNKIRVRYPNAQMLAYCRQHLTLPNPEYEKRLRSNRWVGNTPKTIWLYERDGADIIIPFGCLDDVIGLVERKDIDISELENHPHSRVQELMDSKPIPLFGYQEKAVNMMLAECCGILQSPAGSGKTQCGIAIMQRLGYRALWLTHTHDLLEQSKQRAAQYIDSSLLGEITEGQVNIGKAITFATVQTMSRLDLEQYRHTWGTIIVDECHRVAGTPTSVTMFSKILNSLTCIHKFGLSATVHRADGLIKATFALLGRVKYTVPDEAVADRVMKVRIVPVQTWFQTGIECLNTDGTLNYTRLISTLAVDADRNDLITEVLKENAGHSCLILSERLTQLKMLMENLPPDLRNLACLIDGKMVSKKAKEQRRHSIEEMRTGEKLYLFATYQLAKEGLDIPRLDRLFLVSPQKDSAVITQSIGRIARVCDGKEDPVAYDFVDKSIYCQKAFKKRCTTYRKDGCVIG